MWCVGVGSEVQVMSTWYIKFFLEANSYIKNTLRGSDEERL